MKTRILILIIFLSACDNLEETRKQSSIDLANTAQEYGKELYKNKVLNYCVKNKIYLDFEKIDSAYNDDEFKIKFN